MSEDISTQRSSTKGQIVFPLNPVTSSFGLPNNFNIETFFSKLKEKERDEICNRNKKMFFLVTNSLNECLACLCLCFGDDNIVNEVLQLINSNDEDFNDKFVEMIKKMDKVNGYDRFYENFKINARIFGESYSFLKEKIKKIKSSKLEEDFKKMAKQSTLLFGVKIRFLSNASLNTTKSYLNFRREDEKEEVENSEYTKYLIIDKSEKDLWNVGIVCFENLLTSEAAATMKYEEDSTAEYEILPEEKPEPKPKPISIQSNCGEKYATPNPQQKSEGTSNCCLECLIF